MFRNITECETSKHDGFKLSLHSCRFVPDIQSTYVMLDNTVIKPQCRQKLEKLYCIGRTNKKPKNVVNEVITIKL